MITTEYYGFDQAVRLNLRKLPRFVWTSRPFTLFSFMLAAILFLMSSCSTTKNLSEGEILYTGIGTVNIEGDLSTKAASATVAAIDEALACPPNNSLFGSSSMRIPFPAGLWIYNKYVNSSSGAGKWIFNRFASKPVYISYVNPNVRTAIAMATMRENGFFDGTASYEIIQDRRDPRKAKLNYNLSLNHLYTYDSIRYITTRSPADSIIAAHPESILLKSGMPFSVTSLESERQGISALLRNEGFYYHRPEFTVYQADTLMAPGKVWLRIMRKPGLPQSALTPFRIGNISLFMSGYRNENPTDSLEYNGIKFYYENRMRVRPDVIYKRLFLRTGDLYSEKKEKRTQNALAKLEIFRFAEMQFSPRDTARRNNVLDLSINTLYDSPYNGELQLNVTDKSNNLAGPGAVFSLTKYNLAGGGEILKIEAKGSHEWNTGRRIEGTNLNSYEIGLGATLTLPFVLLPTFSDRGLDYPTYSTFKVSGDLLNRARFFRMTSVNASLSYEFLPNEYHRHVFTPVRLTYTRLQSRTAEFDSISEINPSLRLSLTDQFIPALSYTYTYDDSYQSKPHHVWWETSLVEAGNILSSLYTISGNHKAGKKIFGNSFAQFVKATGEYRYNHRLDKNNRIVFRIMGGAIITYGNSRTAPFSEQFYLGGANSIRAFNIRSIGPGRFIPDDPKVNRYSYIDQTGDLKLEANLEYRFRLAGSLFGATFLDSGGLWLLREDENRPGGAIDMRHFWNDITLGAGLGLRYDLDFIVIRLDAAVGLHLPYNTGRAGYYNIPRFGDAFGYHLAVGYPF
jgi:outer membrane protein assembly factor BamA